MVEFPNAKINLGLQITRRREDGFHDIDTVFFPVNLCDVLEVVNAGNTAEKQLEIDLSGKIISGEIEKNLCVKAYHMLKKDFSELPPIKAHLHKIIPMGAGLGGGSSDGSFMIKLLNKKFNLKLSQEQMIKYSLQLGSDCPFFILNEPVHATGRGEVMTSVALDLSNYKIILICPGLHVSTADAFAEIQPRNEIIPTSEIIKKPVDLWKEHLKNDFEKIVFKKHPILEEIKQTLYKAGAIYASMSGTGSTIYGIFEKEKDLKLPTLLSSFECFII